MSSLRPKYARDINLVLPIVYTIEGELGIASILVYYFLAGFISRYLWLCTPARLYFKGTTINRGAREQRQNWRLTLLFLPYQSSEPSFLFFQSRQS